MDARKMNHANDLGWMIDASHNVKDPLEDLSNLLRPLRLPMPRALIVDAAALDEARQKKERCASTGNIAECLSHGCATIAGRSKTARRCSIGSCKIISRFECTKRTG